jgi:hypothetical protein
MEIIDKIEIQNQSKFNKYNICVKKNKYVQVFKFKVKLLNISIKLNSFFFY